MVPTIDIVFRLAEGLGLVSVSEMVDSGQPIIRLESRELLQTLVIQAVRVRRRLSSIEVHIRNAPAQLAAGVERPEDG